MSGMMGLFIDKSPHVSVANALITLCVAQGTLALQRELQWSRLHRKSEVTLLTFAGRHDIHVANMIVFILSAVAKKIKIKNLNLANFSLNYIYTSQYFPYTRLWKTISHIRTLSTPMKHLLSLSSLRFQQLFSFLSSLWFLQYICSLVEKLQHWRSQKSSV